MEEPVYPHSLEHAIAHDEARAYHTSFQRNVECAAAIDEAVAASRHDQYYYDLTDALNAVVRDFGIDDSRRV